MIDPETSTSCFSAVRESTMVQTCLPYSTHLDLGRELWQRTMLATVAATGCIGPLHLQLYPRGEEERPDLDEEVSQVSPATPSTMHRPPFKLIPVTFPVCIQEQTWLTPAQAYDMYHISFHFISFHFPISDTCTSYRCEVDT